MKQILIVCTGNTCRSPMAEMILKDKLNKKGIEAKVISAGIFACDNQDISPLTYEVLNDNNIKVKNFKSKKITEELFNTSDYIFCMTSAQKKYLKNYKNVYEIGEFTGNIEVCDPFGKEKSQYENVFKQLKCICEKLIELINW
jgi:protein-tyrosine phosphatase